MAAGLRDCARPRGVHAYCLTRPLDRGGARYVRAAVHYCFRLRLEIAGFARIASSRDEFVLEDVEGRSVVLTCPEAHDSGDPTPVVVLGRGYESSEAAEVAGHEWTAVLQRAFAHLNIGADRGTRVSGESVPGATGSGRSMREGWFNDTPGLIVFPEEPWPTFALFTSHGSVGRDPRSLVSAVEDVVGSEFRCRRWSKPPTTSTAVHSPRQRSTLVLLC